VWTYIALGVGVVVALNVLLIAWLAMNARSRDDGQDDHLS
jgi:hypothetical protein